MISRKEVTVPLPYQNYVDKAGDDDLMKALNNSTRRFWKVIRDVPKKKIDFAYAEGKWTIKELLQHIIDAERVFVLRALWFARRDPSAQPGFEENIWAANATVATRKWKNMVEEFLALRAANTFFFASLSDEELSTTGVSGKNVVSTIAFGFISAGHLEHHLDIIKKRYLAETPKTGKPAKEAKEKVKKKKK